MKIYTSNQQIRLVGKGWQIRAYLRQFKNSKTTLQKYLSMSHARVTSQN
ncbi:Z-ring formation inhibitor MciZ [Collibacillus ludicampi]|jgi:hypothetical protein